MIGKAEHGELLGDEPVERFEAVIRAALRRKPSQEAKLAGALRAVAPYSARLVQLLGDTVETLVKRASFDRPLYAGTVRALADVDAERAATEVERALGAEEAGGLATLSAACCLASKRIAEPLARVASSRHPHLAFAAEVARIARSESDGDHISSIAPKIKESHRIALCVDVFVPLLRSPALPRAIAPALAVLRDAERHLGRWLVFGEIAVRAGDSAPLDEARNRASRGPSSARAAWALVAWALETNAAHPSVRPTVELVSRLSDRPSADRDPSFLYRLAEAGVPTARPMLESMARGPLRTDVAVRSAMYLARDHRRDDLKNALGAIADNPRHDGLRGFAAAALFDLGERERLVALTVALVQSRQLTTAAWGGLLRAAQAGAIDRLVSEPTYRRVQLGWLE
ncbi:MAG TPA: hypothetical protein VH062_09115 [Polyangiaceae bacterium]|jgi:hypothetical protein|nr:hypothetical protein [Polyangiaceae bacterium]